MIKPRIIPQLLLKNNQLVKTINFKSPKYVGDPINVIRIFNEKEVDEIILLDIDASLNNKINFKILEKIAGECFMPICYGGGIKSLDHAKKIFNFGIEKIAISSIIHSNSKMISDISNYAGSQSTIVVLDIKKKNNDYKIYIENGKKEIDADIYALINRYENDGMGELVINSIDHDGLMNGYDFDLIDKIFEMENIYESRKIIKLNF